MINNYLFKHNLLYIIIMILMWINKKKRKRVFVLKNNRHLIANVQLTFTSNNNWIKIL